jgi:transcriptional regulator with XRE-family HTH domain
MADNSLLKQLVSRARNLHDQTGISQYQMANAIGLAHGNYSEFLNGKRGIGSESVCALLKFTNMPRAQAIAIFSEPVPTSKITLLQEQGRRMQLDDDGGGWLPGRDPDPSDAGNSIDDPDDDSLDALRRARAIHVKAIGAVDKYLAKARPNPNGTTPPSGQTFSTSRY